jgi:hypothetical protein
MAVIDLVSLSSPEVALTTPAERGFLVAGGHLQNEIVTLTKLMVWSVGGAEADQSDLERNLSGLQMMTIARLLAGKLFEGWRLMEAVYFGSKLSLHQNGLLDNAPKAALKSLKSYFNDRQTIIFKLRNYFGFHYSADALAQAWQHVANEAGFDIVLGDTFANSYHRGAEFAANHAMLYAVEPTDRGKALEQIFEEVNTVAHDFNVLIDGVIHAILVRVGVAGPSSQVELTNLRNFLDVRLPVLTVRVPAEQLGKPKSPAH